MRITGRNVIRFLLEQVEELAGAVQAQDDQSAERALNVERRVRELRVAIQELES